MIAAALSSFRGRAVGVAVAGVKAVRANGCCRGTEQLDAGDQSSVVGSGENNPVKRIKSSIIYSKMWLVSVSSLRFCCSVRGTCLFSAFGGLCSFGWLAGAPAADEGSGRAPGRDLLLQSLRATKSFGLG